MTILEESSRSDRVSTPRNPLVVSLVGPVKHKTRKHSLVLESSLTLAKMCSHLTELGARDRWYLSSLPSTGYLDSQTVHHYENKTPDDCVYPVYSRNFAGPFLQKEHRKQEHL